MRTITIAVAITIAMSGCKTGGGSAEPTPVAQQPTPPTFEPWLTARINGAGDVEYWRSELQRGIFGMAGIPATMPDTVEAIFNPAFDGHNIDRLTMHTDGEQSVAYLIHPHSPNGELAIYHQGHAGGFRDIGAGNVRRLLGAGYRVLAFDMPRIGINAKAPYSHELPLKAFIGPVVSALNWADATYAPSRIIMVGISGGGWATVVAAATDTRIDYSFPVAGSWPCYLRELEPGSKGDHEQVQFCERADLPSYLELYILGSYQQSQLQIFNSADPCCFAGDGALRYGGFIQSRSGDFDVMIDTNDRHVISDWAWGQILGVL